MSLAPGPLFDAVAAGLPAAWAQLFVHGLVSAGVRRAFVSPGSRSTPLALAIANEPRIARHVVIDERAAAFAALGSGRATGEPALLVCTSGSAGAHFFPAIVEGHQAAVPLIVVTADRPWELQRCHASQTIDQTKLYGAFTSFFELGEPVDDAAALTAVLRIAGEVARVARSGPVHVNARFRKPLEPRGEPPPRAWERFAPALARSLASASAFAPLASPSEDAVTRLVELVRSRPRSLVASGPAHPFAVPERAARAVATFVERSGAAFAAEAASQLRFGFPSSSRRPARIEALRRVHPFDLVIEIGGPPTSGAYAELLARSPGATRVLVGRRASEHGVWDAVLEGDPYALLGRAARLLGDAVAPHDPSLDDAEREIDAELAEPGAFTESAVARGLVRALPSGGQLVVGNSGPVRDVDRYASGRDERIKVLHQRGAAGIDGFLASSFGTAVSTRAPTAALIGDVAFAHDCGSLALLREVESPLVIVVVDNGGGRIFDDLPVAGAPAARAVYPELFRTPPRLAIGPIATAFGVAQAEVRTRTAFHAALDAALERRGPTIVTCAVDVDASQRERAAIAGARP